MALIISGSRIGADISTFLSNFFSLACLVLPIFGCVCVCVVVVGCTEFDADG